MQETKEITFVNLSRDKYPPFWSENIRNMRQHLQYISCVKDVHWSTCENVAYVQSLYSLRTLPHRTDRAQQPAQSCKT